MKKNSGFTLLELLLTLTVIAVVTALAIPSMTTFTKNDRLVTNINSMVGHLAYARSEAVKRSQQISMCVSNNTDTPAPSCSGVDWQDGWIVYIDADASNTFDAGEEIIKAHGPFNGNNAVTINNVGTQVIYDNRGYLASNTGSLQLCDERPGPHGKTINFSMTGRVRMEVDSAC